MSKDSKEEGPKPEGVKIDWRVEDFYFRCEKLGCSMLASSCEKNRMQPGKSDALMILKQSAQCRKCPNWQEQQQNSRQSKEEFHKVVLAGMAESDKNPKAIRPTGGRYSDWVGSGRTHTRIN